MITQQALNELSEQDRETIELALKNLRYGDWQDAGEAAGELLGRLTASEHYEVRSIYGWHFSGTRLATYADADGHTLMDFRTDEGAMITVVPSEVSLTRS